MNYSAKFKRYILDPEKVKKLINDSDFRGIKFEDWENARRFISKYINKDGKILDIGCANGFFLLCLQEWSGYKLEPFGIDRKEEVIGEAKKFFKNHKENFIKKNVFKISELPSNFPKKFDIIFWSVWREWEFKLSDEVRALNEVLQLVKPGGRLIFGFYDGREKSVKQINRMKELGLRFVRTVKNPTGVQMLTWVDVT